VIIQTQATNLAAERLLSRSEIVIDFPGFHHQRNPTLSYGVSSAKEMRDPPFILEVRKYKLVHVQKDGRALYNRQVHCRVQRANCMTPILQEVAGE
jgi:hypothetical protein